MKKTISVIISFFIILSLLTSAVYANPYSYDPIMGKIYDVYSRAISKSGRENFFGYCGVCVGHQLLAYGVNTEYIGLDGNQSYAHYSAKQQTSGGYYTRSFPASQYSMAQLINHLNADSSSGAAFPVVIGFNKGTASAAGQKYGHTMLIYEVCGGYVYYADSTISTWQDNIHKSSINDFLWLYSDKADTAATEFVYDGGVQFYKSAPKAATVRLSSNQVSLWQPIDFYVSAPGSTGYAVAIDRDGQRITNVYPGVGTYSTLQFGEPGVYTAYVSSWNAYGCIDSTKVTFEVLGAPVSPYIRSASSQVALTSPVNIEFGARNATGYCIGVTSPNGEYNVYFTDKTAFAIPTSQRGIYTIFVTCCNGIGYVDTERINVNVY